MTGRWIRRIAPVAVLAAGACVATRSDVRVLQNDLAVMRAELVEQERARLARLDSVTAQLGVIRDSLSLMSGRIARLQGDTREELYGLAQQLIQIQELTGQSQRRLQELRASMEQRALEAAAQQQTTPAPAPGAPSPDAASAPPSEGPQPGPNQLFQLALEQLRRGSAATARQALLDLLQQHPTADIAPDAEFYVAETFAAERNVPAADSVYAVVVTRFPESPRASTAMYKRALILRDANRTREARSMLTALIERYPRSDEAVLARDLLNTLR